MARGRRHTAVGGAVQCSLFTMTCPNPSVRSGQPHPLPRACVSHADCVTPAVCVHDLGASTLRPRVLVAQSSAMLSQCSPLHTARQWLARWRGEGMQPAAVAARVLKDAGLAADAETPLGRAVCALVGGGGGGDGSPAAREPRLSSSDSCSSQFLPQRFTCCSMSPLARFDWAPTFQKPRCRLVCCVREEGVHGTRFTSQQHCASVR